MLEHSMNTALAFIYISAEDIYPKRVCAIIGMKREWDVINTFTLTVGGDVCWMYVAMIWLFFDVHDMPNVLIMINFCSIFTLLSFIDDLNSVLTQVLLFFKLWNY